MPAKTITDSANIASLDFNQEADLCAGIFHVDLLSSIWIGGGASNVEGASVKIVNPYGVTIKNYPSSGYDIYPPMTSDVDVNVPTQASNYQYGTYQVTVRLTDEDGTDYELTKPLKICAPDSKNKTKNYGSLTAQMDGDCTTGKVTIIVDTPPNYQGYTTDSQVNNFTLLYPTVSEVAPEEDITLNNFTAQLYEGEYKLTGTICALYSLGDNTFVKVNYKVKKVKNIRCLLDRACIAANLAQLQNQLDSDCSDAEKIDTQNTIIQTLFLLTTIDALIKDGQDGSEFIDKLETVLGCVCTCNCAEGTPIIPTVTTNDFVVEGCNVSSETAGLTTTYTIENYSYVTEITDNGGAVLITAPTLDDCTQTQTITFNIAVVYAQIKAQINSDSEYGFWAAVTNVAWNGLDVSCLDITDEVWASYTFKQRGQVIINKLCESGNCEAAIVFDELITSGNDVTISWTNSTAPFEVAVYMDSILQGTVLGSLLQFTIEGAADGNTHTYTLYPKCSNGDVGTPITGTFAYFGCPTIAPPTVTDNNVPDATCPYDLTALVNTLPLGITAEYHNLPNTNASSLVADATQVSDGSYYIYAKDANGCYSLPVNVIIVCSTETACSSPQNIQITALTGSYRVRFQSAAYPPPLNSYTVKRKLASDPDVPGSYTTIGTPTWNTIVSRWEIRDVTAVDNTLYTYRAISNCTSSSPYIDYEFANLTCPVVTLTPASTEMEYSFTSVSANITKYEVRIYESDGVTLIHTDTVLPTYSTPITGTFIYLTPGEVYNVSVRVYIGTYYRDCAQYTDSTIGDNVTISNNVTDASITTSTVSGSPWFLVDEGAFPLLEGEDLSGIYTAGFTGAIQVVIADLGSLPTSCLSITVNGTYLEGITVSAAGTYTFSSDTYLTTDLIQIALVEGICA